MIVVRQIALINTTAAKAVVGARAIITKTTTG